jgi:hypothetical protein
MINLKSSYISLGFFILIIAAFMVPVSAHGLHFEDDSDIVIADESTGLLAKTTAIDMGIDIKVFKYKSEWDVEHELEHAVSNPYKKILAVAYQDTVREYIKKHPEISNRVFVADGDETSIRQGLIKVTAAGPSINFVDPLFFGILIGLLFGLGIGAAWMKRKIEME